MTEIYKLLQALGRALTNGTAIFPTIKGDKGDKGDRGEQGLQGDRGDTVILGDGQEYTLYGTIGNNADGAMTQEAITNELTKVSEETMTQAEYTAATIDSRIKYLIYEEV